MKTNGINIGALILFAFCSILVASCFFWSGCSSADDEETDGDSENSDGDSEKPDGDSVNGGDGDTDAGAEDSEENAEDGDEAVIGAFVVNMIAPSAGDESDAGYTSFYGKIYDAPTPQQIIWEEAAAEGSCRLLKPRVPYCSPACQNASVCVEDGVCRAYSTSQNVGTVHVKGIMNNNSEDEFDLEPISNSYQTTSLPFPAFDEGDAISVSTSGSEFAEAFSIETFGIAPFEIDNGDIAVSNSQPINLSWTPAGQSGISNVHVKLDISHHGGSKGKIECDGEDNGSLEIPAALVSELLNLGVAGFPTIVVARQSVAGTRISAGLVELSISSSVEKAVVIAGLVSCNSDDDCPEGQTCLTSLMCE